ncbi:MAG TPA: NAD(+)/NADH kinase [Longimicrobiales bacterium]|nr:NAD(+)/NADH kinase [Longimicrobiales bacterium]
MTQPLTGKLEGGIASVGIVVRERSPEILRALDRLTAWLGERSVGITVEREGGPASAPGQNGLDVPAGSLDLVIALGGDGTLLRAARAVVGTDTPVLGVNLGRLGFLTAFPDAELESGLAHVFDGRAELDYRFTLRGHIERAGRVHGDNFFALNDIVLHTSGAARVTPLTLHVGTGADREEVGSFAADGVILATPTGSTAYSMSAGGPIIVPDVECVVVTPICPHSLAVRPLVIPARAVLSVSSLDPDARHQVTVDGQVERSLEASEAVVVAREGRPVALVRLPGQTFFRTMRRKLNWAARAPERA